MSWEWGNFGDYVSADEKRRRADAAARKLATKGRALAPVRLPGRAIADTFWGKAWCANLESYSDYASRLPRGRSYVRNGAVLDVQIRRGEVSALVSGTALYNVTIKITPLPKAAWEQLKRACAGKVGSLIDLLRGKLSAAVMEVITRKAGGLFPKPTEIGLDCSCPDWAEMCKHVAAALYAVGSRLDEHPELLFALRGVDHLELIADTADTMAADLAAPAPDGNTLDESGLAEIFGIELASISPVKLRKPSAASPPPPAPKQRKRAAKTGKAAPVKAPVPRAGKTRVGKDARRRKTTPTAGARTVPKSASAAAKPAAPKQRAAK